jgi:hypothetical protein
VARTAAFPMPDFDLSFNEGQEGPVLAMKRRSDTPTGETPAPRVTA